jgi:hypothetical protein
MTSPTDKTWNRRYAKKAKMGRKSKNKLLKTGTTPPLFALNKPELNDANK